MDLKLAGKKVVITGGAKGIGEAIVRSFHAELTELDDIAAAVDAIHNQVGPIDVLVNNAGVNDGVGLDKPPAEFIASLERNLIHPFALAHHLREDLVAARGSIINIGSKVAETGQGGTSGYAASKGGLNALTREWALDLAPQGVRVNCVVPAEVMTPLYEKWLAKLDDPAATKARIEATIPLEHRFTLAEEIADLVVFLASPRSGHTTGQILYPDGGYTHLDRACTSAPEVSQ